MSHEEPTNSLKGHPFQWALCFEIGLGVLALLIGKISTTWPIEWLNWPPKPGMLVIGVLSALPPLVLMLALRRAPWTAIREFNTFVDEQLTPMFRGLAIYELALLSLAAGWGEELLFRGLIQSEFALNTSPLAGILAASLLFAVVHFMTPAYFVLAFSISIYFGALYWHFESLWVPILGHATYDFLMLMILCRRDTAAIEENGTGTKASSHEPKKSPQDLAP